VKLSNKELGLKQNTNTNRIDPSGKGHEDLKHVVRDSIYGSRVWKNPIRRGEPTLYTPLVSRWRLVVAKRW